MGSSSGDVFVKIFLSATAAIIMLFGIALIAVGSILHSFFYENRNVFVDNEAFQFPIVSIVTISVGVGILLIGICGIVGALRENRCLLVMYGIFMFLFFLVMLVAGLLLLLIASESNDAITKAYNETFTKEYSDSAKDGDHIMDYVQTKWTCCGVKGPDDYKEKGLITTNFVPNSCCENDTSLSREEIIIRQTALGNLNTCLASNAHQRGCLQPILDYVDGKLTASLAVSFTMAAILLLASITACCFACHVGRRDHGQIY